MTATLATTETTHTLLARASARAREFVCAAKATNTLRAYRASWAHFKAWCAAHGLEPLPASVSTVVAYLSAEADRSKVSTLELRVAAISQAHQMAGHESPTQRIQVRTVMAGIRRSKGTRPDAKRPILAEDIRAIVAELPDSPLGKRDRALLLLGFAGAFRRSELVGLNVEDLEFAPAGVVVTLRRSKTDQQGEGRKVGIPLGANPETCPVRALGAWIEASGADSGPLFRSADGHGKIRPVRLTAQSVALVVKRHARVIGKDAGDFSGHSLRAGHATQAAANGASERSIMNQTGHRSEKMVRRYIREGSLFRENAASRLGL